MSNKKFNDFIKVVLSNNLETVKKRFQPQYLDQSDNEGRCPIHLVCLKNLVEIFKFFMKKECDIELCDDHKWRPIHCAVRGGAVEIVKLLIGQRCEINCETDKGETVLDLANNITENQESIIKILNMTIANRKIGIEMNLKCHIDCDHGFCLISLCLNNFKKDIMLGRGSYGKVFKVIESRGNREFAVKKVAWSKTDLSTTEEKCLNSVKDESKFLEDNINKYRTMLHHEHLIQYFGAITQESKMLIFMEYAVGGSVYDKIKNDYENGLPQNLIIKYCQHVLKGLDFLHKQTIIHRDIKPENILLDKNDNCKLTDLGFSRLLESISKHNTNSKNRKNKKDENDKKKNAEAKTYCGTANYMAPEIINGEQYSYPCDLWSLGATIIEMLTGKPPHCGLPQNKVLIRVGSQKTIEYTTSSPLPPDMKKFIDQLLKPKPVNRGSAEDLLKNKLFKNL